MNKNLKGTVAAAWKHGLADNEEQLQQQEIVRERMAHGSRLEPLYLLARPISSRHASLSEGASEESRRMEHLQELILDPTAKL